MLGRLQLKKQLGAALDENMLRAALGKKLRLWRLQLKKQLGAALDKNMLREALGKKLCLGRLQLKRCWVLRKIKICLERR